MGGQQCKGAYADCVRFGTGVLDELYRFKRCPTARLPQDMALHNRKGAFRAMRFIRRLYMPNVIVTDETIEPMDFIITGPIGGGPGHMQLVGTQPNVIWECVQGGVQRTGISSSQIIYRIYRPTDKDTWL